MLPSNTPSASRQPPQPVSAAQLLTRICVRPPYFALSDLHAGTGRLRASARAELPQGPECGPIQGAELSRHAAIAGLCVAALAQTDDQRRYYLAQQAHYRGFDSRAPYGSAITLQAELLSLSKREASARIEASADGQALAVVEVLYTILTDSAFSRLFRSRERPDFSAPPTGAMPLLPEGTTVQRGGRWTRHIERVPEEACAGHFERYPAMPVAILMGQLSQLAGQALGGGQPFHVAEARVDARDFCWAGEPATFQVEASQVEPSQTEAGSQDGRRTVFDCLAIASERTVGHMQLALEPR